jgi:hypothetical protein
MSTGLHYKIQLGKRGLLTIIGIKQPINFHQTFPACTRDFVAYKNINNLVFPLTIYP